MACAYSIRFSYKSCINRCSTQCKWNDLKPIELCKCSNTVGWPTHSVSVIERTDSNSKGDLFNIAIILASRSSRGGFPVRISSWRSWRPNYTSTIQNSTIWSL
jgi:hypothetical protein